MKTIGTLALCLLASGSVASAQSTIRLPRENGSIDISIDVSANHIGHLAYLAPGQSFAIEVTCLNRSSKESDAIVAPINLRYVVAGSTTEIVIAGEAIRVDLDAGETHRKIMNVMMPRDAEVGSRFHLGTIVGTSSGMAGALFLSGIVERGLTTSPGIQLGSMLGANRGLGLGLGTSPSVFPRPPFRPADPVKKSAVKKAIKKAKKV